MSEVDDAPITSGTMEPEKPKARKPKKAAKETELSRLDPDRILDTAETLSNRIRERFPASGLSGVAEQLVHLAGKAKARSAWIERPNLRLRATSIVVIATIVIASVAAVVVSLREGNASGRIGLPELVQIGESAVNDLVLLGAAIFFLLSFETRAKRARVFRAVQELRTLAHLVDVHQLTKNPEVLRESYVRTPSSPTHSLDAFGMSRYLDYCSEMLSLIGKIAALYCDAFDDADAVQAVTDLEQMAIGLQRKIWQKIIILEGRARERPPLG